MCVCVQINHEPSSSWSVLLALPPQPSSSQALGAGLSLPGRVPQVVFQRARAYLVLVLEVGRKRRREGRRKAGREGGKEGRRKYTATDAVELEELNFLTLTLCTAYS